MNPFEIIGSFRCDGSVISVAATPNLSTIIAATVGRSIYMIDQVGTPIWETPRTVDFEAWACDISQDGRIIAAGTANKVPSNGTIFIFARDGRQLVSFPVNAPVWSVSLSADGSMLAASTWTNKLVLCQRKSNQYVISKQIDVPGNNGLYGVKLTQEGDECLVTSYDNGLFTYNREGKLTRHLPIPDGMYNISLAPNAKEIFVGTRSGNFIRAPLNSRDIHYPSHQLSQRPLCGISASNDGRIVGCGSFDGRIIISTNEGDELWTYQTKGEIWTTAISGTGEIVCAGSGDHHIRIFRNLCNTSAWEEIAALESSFVHAGTHGRDEFLDALSELYVKYRLSSFGYERLGELINNDDAFLRERRKKFLTIVIAQSPGDTLAHFRLGNIFVEERQFREAVEHFQVAASNPYLRSLAHRGSAKAFSELRLNAAAISSWRRSREQYLDDQSRHSLYMLAKSYEDCGAWKEAARIYEMILTWDAKFRNSWSKLNTASGFKNSSAIAGSDEHPKDYTGSTISLLGPDAPREVDPQISEVLKARSREVSIASADRELLKKTVEDLLSDTFYSRGIRRDVTALSYDVQLFLKYDYGLPEDEMKKFLETVNAIPFFHQVKASTGKPRSLDIGSATGRYPSLLLRLGFQAYGIDIEEQAVIYSKGKVNNAEWPKFVHGNALDLNGVLPSPQSFDLITCMMGTFEHLPFTDQSLLLSVMFNRLASNGVTIISVWDVECPHLAYLTMYDERQREMIRRNCRTQAEMCTLMTDSGFSNVRTIPFSMLPQTAIYDLGIDKMEASDIELAAQADLVVKSLYGSRHGEMFLAIGSKI